MQASTVRRCLAQPLKAAFYRRSQPFQCSTAQQGGRKSWLQWPSIGKAVACYDARVPHAVDGVIEDPNDLIRRHKLH